MIKVLAKYHAHLVAQTEALGPQTRWMALRGFMLPWFIPIVIGGVIPWAFNLDEEGRLLIFTPFAVVGLGGMFYAGGVVLYYGVRADIRRMKETRARGR